MVDQIFSYGELGFQEFETSKYLVGVLKKNGFDVEEGVAGIPTAFMATWGIGKPVIALGSDIDGIPQSSQKPGVGVSRAAGRRRAGPRRGPQLRPGREHHGGDRAQEDHGARKDPRHDPHLAGRGRGARRHEGVLHPRGSVQGRRRRAVHARRHATSTCPWGDGGGTGLVSVLYSFQGESAHAAAAPWRGRSALDAVELMDVGWNFRREHLPLVVALALRDHRRRRSAERRAADGVRLVLLPPGRRSRASRTCGRSAIRSRRAPR